MQRVKTATAITEKPAYNATGTPGYFRSGDAVAAIPATVPGQDWFNMVQEEILAVIVAAGMTPDPETDTQLADAILALIVAHAPAPAQATTTSQGIVELATSAEAIAGTDTERAVTPATLAAALAANSSGTSFGTALILSRIGR